MIRNNWLRSDNCRRMGVYFLALAVLLLLSSTRASAQEPFFSFEDGLHPWITQDATIVQSEFGATHGASAMKIEGLTSGWKSVVASTDNFGSATPGLTDVYNAFNVAAGVIANGGTPSLEFDLTWDFAGVTQSNWLQLGLAINSQAGWKEYSVGEFIVGNADISSSTPVSLDSIAVNDGATLTMIGPASARVAVPFGPTKMLNISPGSTYYHMQFRSSGAWEGTIDFAIDNIRFTGVPIYEEYTLFSWETPDNPATPDVDERFEGWMPNPDVTPATQNLSITSTGATHGDFALQLDRTPLKDGFTWGSMFGLDATANPADEGRIDDIVTRINAASQIAIDITYQDQFPISPTGTRLYLAFADDAGTWYQAGSASFNINNKPPGTMETLIFDLEAFADYNNPGNTLANTGLLVDTNQLGIFLGTATNDGAIYQIDNFRLLTEVVDSMPGDFNKDGQVDGRDFLVWQRGGSPNPQSAGDLAEWQAAYGGGGNLSAVTAAVPEPSSALLIAVSLLALGIRRP